MGKDKTSGRRRRTWFRVAAGVAGLIVAVLLAEGITRMAGLAPAIRPINITGVDSCYRRSDNPILGFEHKPNYRNDDPDEIFSCAYINAHGQRDVERTVAKPAGTRRIILLGDSVVESIEVRNIEDMMHRHLERLYGDGTEVLNFGVNGYCTLAEVELLEVKGLKFKPDVAVIVFVGNDFHNFNAAAHHEADPAARPAVINWLFKKSDLFRVTSLWLDLFSFGADADPVGRNRDAIGDNNVVIGLQRLRALADREKMDVLIAVWPEFRPGGIVDPGPYAPDGKQLLIESLARANGIASVRLSASFASQYRQVPGATNPRDAYTVGDMMHANEAGCRAGATALKEALDRLPELSAAARRNAAAADAAAIQAAGDSDERGYDYVANLVDSGATFQQRGHLDKAIRYYRLALSMDPDCVAAHLNLSVALCAQKQYDQAVEHCRKAAALDAKNAVAHYNWGNALIGLGRSEQAAGQYRSALALDARHAPSLNNLAVLASRAGRVDEALALFDRALAANPSHHAALISSAPLLAGRGKFAEAASRYRRALALAPNNVVTLNNCARLLATCPDAAVRNGADAVALAQRLCRLTGNRDAIALDTLAAALAETGRFDQAVKTATEAAALAERGGNAAMAAVIRKHVGLFAARAPLRERP